MQSFFFNFFHKAVESDCLWNTEDVLVSAVVVKVLLLVVAVVEREVGCTDLLLWRWSHIIYQLLGMLWPAHPQTSLHAND